MVSRKNQGFQVSESRQNRVRLNVSKCDDGCLLDVFRLEPAMDLIGRTEPPFLKPERNGTAVKWSGVLEMDAECVTV